MNKLIEMKIRHVIVNELNEVKKLLLTKNQLGIIKLASKRKQLFAINLANYAGISIQNASGQLRTLWKKGYLKREHNSSMSGGKEYSYYTDY